MGGENRKWSRTELAITIGKDAMHARGTACVIARLVAATSTRFGTVHGTSLSGILIFECLGWSVIGK